MILNAINKDISCVNGSDMSCIIFANQTKVKVISCGNNTT